MHTDSYEVEINIRGNKSKPLFRCMGIFFWKLRVEIWILDTTIYFLPILQLHNIHLFIFYCVRFSHYWLITIQ